MISCQSWCATHNKCDVEHLFSTSYIMYNNSWPFCCHALINTAPCFSFHLMSFVIYFYKLSFIYIFIYSLILEPTTLCQIPIRSKWVIHYLSTLYAHKFYSPHHWISKVRKPIHLQIVHFCCDILHHLFCLPLKRAPCFQKKRKN